MPGMLERWWRNAQPPLVPKGLIVFLNDTVIPDDWSRFTPADNLEIIGAGSTYSPGATGGSNVVFNYSGSLASGGYHNAAPHPYADVAHLVYPGNIPYSLPTVSSAHAHAISNMNYVHEKRSALMIKSNKALPKLPAKSLLFSGASLSCLTNITSFNNKYIQAGTTISDIPESKTFDISSAGSHVHVGGEAGYLSSLNYTKNGNTHTSGAHSASGLIYGGTITDNLKKVLLSLWTNQSTKFGLASGMIAMWESLVPPDGWVLCNGSNGTPDCRDGFIMPVTAGSENLTQSGNNTLDFGATAETHYATHHHISGPYSNVNWKGRAHGSYYAWGHSHTINEVTDVSWLPPYYTLSFIMKL